MMIIQYRLKISKPSNVFAMRCTLRIKGFDTFALCCHDKITVRHSGVAENIFIYKKNACMFNWLEVIAALTGLFHFACVYQTTYLVIQ